jgi:hypothetical protein
MAIDDETLMAYADGELSALETKRVEAAMAEDAALAARVARFRAVRRALRTAYDSVAAEPVPEHLRALLGDVATAEPRDPTRVASIATAREKRALRFGPPAWAAIAASLIVGVIAGRAVLPSQSFFTGEAGHLYAGGELTRVLDTRLASATENANAETRIGLTFRAKDGDVCRTFSHGRDANTLSGLACRDGERWAVRLAVSGPTATGGDYQQASSAAPAVLAAVDDMIDGEALDPTQEQALRDHHWRD